MKIKYTYLTFLVEKEKELSGTFMKYLLLITIIFSFQAFAYIPTLESLLRNGNNVDIANNTVVANLNIKMTPAENAEKQTSAIVQNNAYKFIIFNEREDYPKFVQLQYVGGKITNSTLHDLKVFSFHKLSEISKNRENLEQRFFYSLMGILLRNDGSLMIDFLKEQGIRVQTNRELVNKEKTRLLKDYRYYLKKTKESSSVANDLKNPLSPSEQEDKIKVEEILARPYLSQDSMVKRFKNGDYFNWIVENDQLFISFDYDHRLEEITLKNSQGEMKVTCGRYILQGSNLEFPELVTMTDFNGNKYEIKLSSLKMFADSSQKHFDRLKKYKEKIDENKITEVAENLKIIL